MKKLEVQYTLFSLNILRLKVLQILDHIKKNNNKIPFKKKKEIVQATSNRIKYVMNYS